MRNGLHIDVSGMRGVARSLHDISHGKARLDGGFDLTEALSDLVSSGAEMFVSTWFEAHGVLTLTGRSLASGVDDTCDRAKQWTDTQASDLADARSAVSAILRDLDDIWTGESADAFRARILEFHDSLEASEEAMRIAGKGILAYADAVAEIARRAAPLKHRLEAAELILNGVHSEALFGTDPEGLARRFDAEHQATIDAQDAADELARLAGEREGSGRSRRCAGEHGKDGASDREADRVELLCCARERHHSRLAEVPRQHRSASHDVGRASGRSGNSLEQHSGKGAGAQLAEQGSGEEVPLGSCRARGEIGEDADARGGRPGTRCRCQPLESSVHVGEGQYRIVGVRRVQRRQPAPSDTQFALSRCREEETDENGQLRGFRPREQGREGVDLREA